MEENKTRLTYDLKAEEWQAEAMVFINGLGFVVKVGSGDSIEKAVEALQDEIATEKANGI
jgi:hypothetical protein